MGTLRALGTVTGSAPHPSYAAPPAAAKPADKPRGRKRIDADKIPPRAWAAADYLRSQLIAEDATVWVSRQPWGIDQRTGARLAWADTFRKLNEIDGREWDDIARTVSWLFKQPPGPRFIVQSPDALREKWDRIQATRRNQQAQAKQPPGRGQVDNRPAQQFKKWGSE